MIDRPLTDLRPVGPFVGSIREDSGNDNDIWAVYHILVDKPNVQFDSFSEGMLIRNFGGIEHITQAADKVFEELAEKKEAAGGFGQLDIEQKVAVSYDIIPPADGEGIRLQYKISEGHNSELGRDNISIGLSHFKEQKEYYTKLFEDSFPDSKVTLGMAGAAGEKPTFDVGTEMDTLLYLVTADEML